MRAATTSMMHGLAASGGRAGASTRGMLKHDGTVGPPTAAGVAPAWDPAEVDAARHRLLKKRAADPAYAASLDVAAAYLRAPHDCPPEHRPECAATGETRSSPRRPCT